MVIWASLVGLAALVSCLFSYYSYSFIECAVISVSSLISTLIAFNWMVPRSSNPSTLLLSIRPIFLSIMWLTLVVGPLPRIAGLQRYGINYGIENYYWYSYLLIPLAFLSYEVIYRLTYFKSEIIDRGFSRSNMLFKKYLSLGLSIVCFAIFLYLINKFGIIRGFNVAGMKESNILLNYLYYLYDGFLCISVGCSVFWIVNANRNIERIWPFLSIFIVLVILLTLQSRTRAAYLAVSAMGSMQLIKSREKTFMYAFSILAITVILYLFVGIGYKGYSTRKTEFYQPNVSYTYRLDIYYEFLTNPRTWSNVARSAMLDLGYRLNVLEWSTAMLASNADGVPFMWGKHLLWSLNNAVPEILAPIPKLNPEAITNKHFRIVHFDQNTSIFGSAVADGWFIGIPLYFGCLGLIHAAIWRRALSFGRDIGVLVILSLIPTFCYFGHYIGTHVMFIIRNGIIYLVVLTVLDKLLSLPQKQ